MKADAWYYSSLSKEEKQVYYLLEQGLREKKTRFQVPRIGDAALENCYFRVRMDHPELFYAPSFQACYTAESSTYEVSPKYLYTKNQIAVHEQALRSRAEKLCRGVLDAPETEKLRFVHDFICTAVHYDKLKKDYSHEITGPLENGVGVCEGIAKTVKFLCDYLGIWCITALSERNPEKQIRYRHMWNVISMGGNYYHLDVTFDNTLSVPGVIRYDYYRLSDSHFFMDHEPVIFPVPPCSDSKAFYYRQQKLCFQNQEEVEKRISQAAKKGKPFVFVWDYGNGRASLREVYDIAVRSAEKFGRGCTVYGNTARHVVMLTFSQAGSNLLEQQADIEEQNTEGEPVV